MCGTIDMAWIPECFPTKCLFFIYFDLKIWPSHKTNIPKGRMNFWPGRNLWHKFVKTRVWEKRSWLDRKLRWLLIFLSERCILCLKDMTDMTDLTVMRDMANMVDMAKMAGITEMSDIMADATLQRKISLLCWLIIRRDKESKRNINQLELKCSWMFNLIMMWLKFAIHAICDPGPFLTKNVTASSVES